METGSRSAVAGWGLMLALAAALVGCGDSDTASDPAATSVGSPSSSTSETGSASASSSAQQTPSAPPDTPQCEDVWIEGERLPLFYKGCLEGDTYVPRDILGCSSGQRLVRYADHFYAVLRGEIHQTESRLDEDRGYRGTIARCRA